MKNLGKQYLDNLDLVKNESHETFLNNMVSSHLSNFTFNNIEVLLNKGKILSLEVSELFNKIVLEKRGGYCFEHNKLFYSVLKDLDFQVEAKLARVVYNRDVDAGRTHRVTIVNIEEERFLADVGFGPYTPNQLIPLDGKHVTCQNNSIYRVTNDSDGKYQLEVLKKDGFFILYTFELINFQESDFNIANYFTNTHPSSKFVNELVLSRIDKSKTFLINNLSYSEMTELKREDSEISNSKDLNAKLSKEFFIHLNENDLNKLHKVLTI